VRVRNPPANPYNGSLMQTSQYGLGDDTAMPLAMGGRGEGDPLK
jgi:hypothetical protein